MNNHFIFDFETIGQDVFKIPVVNCAYYVFDWDRFTSDNPYTFNELTQNIKFSKLNIKAQLEAGCSYNKRDIDWWLSLPDHVKAQLKPHVDDLDVEQFCLVIYDYLKSEGRLKRWWSRSNTFDPILMARLFGDSIGRDKMDEVLKFWLVRDIRTYIDTQFDFNPNIKNGFCPIDDEKLWAEHFEEHNCIHDVAADIMRLQKIERTIKL